MGANYLVCWAQNSLLRLQVSLKNDPVAARAMPTLAFRLAGTAAMRLVPRPGKATIPSTTLHAPSGL